MFKNEVAVRASSALSGSKVKQLQTRLASSYPTISRDDWLSLVLVKQPNLTLDKTTQHAVVYTDSSIKQPLFFDPNGKGDLILPTVYTLWRLPNMLRRLVIPSQVHSRLLSGADLMVPGLQPGSELDGILVNEVVAICAIGSDHAIAVGVMLMNEREIQHSGGKGKCTKIYHVFGDGLWQYGDQSVPSGRLTENPLTDSQDVAGDAVAEDEPPVDEVDQQADGLEELNIVSEEPIEDLKAAIESALTDYLQSASAPVACGDAADAVAARDPRFNIRSTPYRTWDMLFRVFVKRGLIKVKDGVIVSINMPTIQSNPNEEDEDTVDIDHMDEFLERALIAALKTRISDSDLPLSASMLADHVYAATSNSLNVKNSSYKSFGKLFKAFAKRNLIKLKEHKNVVTLVSINRNAEELRSDGADVAAVNGSKPKPQQKATKPSNKITVLTKYEPNKHVRFLFGSAPSKELFTMDDCKKRLQNYIQSQGLRLDRGLVRLDDTLKELLFTASETPPDQISLKDVGQRLERHLVMYSAIVGGDEEPVFCKGVPPNIEVVVEKVGQKIRTRVKNLEAFGLDSNVVAQDGQKRFACSTAVKPLPGKSRTPLYEVLIQGKFDKEICDYLKTSMGVPLHLINVIRKDIKSR